MKKTILLFSCVFSLAAVAQEKEKKWDVNNPGAPSKEISFETTEGTWMNLDVSPDGKTIVFDLLGDIYTMPIAGGNATCIHSGLAWEVHPRFSPDGKKIAFCSDAGGGDNIWTMNADGTNAKQITKENYRLMHNPVWTPDGQYIIARKHFTSTRSLGAGEMWMYHITGGDGIQLTKRKNDQQDVNEPCLSPDGKYLYYSEDVYPGGYFQYNKNPNAQIYVINRYNTEKGTTEGFVGGAGGACRPQVSRDGKKLAFIRRVREKTVLYVRNIESGEEWPVYNQLTKDQMEAWAIFGVYTNFSWVPGDKEIIIWSAGKINKIDITASPNKATVIPFKATCKHKITQAVRFKQNINPDTFTARTLMRVCTSPDGKSIVFSAVGSIWKKNLPDGKPERITSATGVFESEPAFSPDGKEIVYVTWNDESTGSVIRYNVTSKKSQVVSGNVKGILRYPSFSPDGKKILFVKEYGNEQLGFNFSNEPGIYVVGADNKPSRVRDFAENPSFTSNGQRIIFQQGGYPSFSYSSCDLTGNDERTHFTSKYGNEISISPDNKWVAFRDLFKVYIAAFPVSGKTVDLSSAMGDVPVTCVTTNAGYNMHWSADSKKLMWTLGNDYFSTEVNKRFTFLEGSPDSIAPVENIKSIAVNLEIKTDKPTGVIAFTNARIITMKGNEVIEKGTIVIRDNKIESVGKTDEVKIPAGAVVKDMTGKTIMPGFVDVHAHVGHFRSGILPQKHWPYYANLAYGVTTTHDPSANTETVFGLSELVRAGKMVGPRVFSTGWILYGAEGDFRAVVNSIDDARSALRRTKAFGAFSVKSYNQPRREQRQMIIQAAREEQMMVVPEGGSTYSYNMTHIIDGHTGVEHNLPVAPLYNDVIQIWKNSETGYTPTLIVAYNALSGENYWYQHTNVWEKERLLKYTPRPIIDSRSRHRNAAPEAEYVNGHILTSKSCKALNDAGVKVNMGAHGQLQGLGAHWEIWMLQQGGMTNHEALRAATLNGAHYLGLDDMVGSLEAGKLADLLIMDKNPLEDIKNTESLTHTMINGRLYDCETMNETASGNNNRTKFFWEISGSTDAFQLDTETCTFGHNHCSCGKH